MSEPRVLVLNGPNLGRLGSREPVIYGSTTYAELAALCVKAGDELGLAVEVRQTDHEGELLGWLHEAADAATPVAVRDACAALVAPLVEVHITNVHKREEFRHHSYVSGVATGVIMGLGVEGYVLALSWLSSTLGVAGD